MNELLTREMGLEQYLEKAFLGTEKLRTIKQKALVEELVQLKGATFITMIAETDARARKTDNPYGKITKRNRVSGIVNFYYAEGVRRRLAREGKDPESFREGTSWHEPIFHEDGTMTPLCKNKKDTGKLYVRFMLLSILAEPEYFSETWVLLTAEQVKPFLPKEKHYENQGLDEPLQILTYGLDSIREVSFGGYHYLVV